MNPDPREYLYIYGFLKKGAEDASLDIKGRRKKIKKAGDKEGLEKLYKQTDPEILEVADNTMDKTEYPSTDATFRLVYEAASTSLEEHYFWILEHLRQDRGFSKITKVLDMYSASEASAFWGNQQQRITAQQNQASSFLATIGKMTREVFQIVREIRIIEERLEMYEAWNHKDEDGKVHRSDSADVTLKSLFTDQVEGGTKNPQSVFGLAQTVGFTILPDLFFNTRVYSTEALDKKIEAMDYNTSVKNVLRRKLYQFLIWKERTHDELKTRYEFNKKYLRQHWASVQMYMTWVKPYLRNLRRLRMNQELSEDAEMVASFDQSMSEVEFIAHGPGKGVVMVTFRFRSRPEMSIRKEYQQGPSHMGRVEMFVRGYKWTGEQIENYKEMRKQEEMDMLGMLDDSLETIMDALGEDFMRYLDKKDETEDEEKEESKKIKTDITNTLEPFIAIFGGFGELFGPFMPKMRTKSAKKKGGKARSGAGDAFLTWHIYKKAHRMLTW